MKKNMVPLVAIAFVVAVISTAVFYGLFAGKLRSGVRDSPTQQLVAARNLDRGTVLQASDLRVSELHGQTALKGLLARPEQAVGQTLLDAVQAGEPITDRRLVPERASGAIAPGMRAVSIRVAESSGLTSMLRPGAKVDLQVVIGRESAVQLRTILQNVEVLSVNPQPEVTREGGSSAIVTVLTHWQDADSLALADSGGRIRVTLRNALDKDVFPARPMALPSLFQPGREPAPNLARGTAR